MLHPTRSAGWHHVRPGKHHPISPFLPSPLASWPQSSILQHHWCSTITAADKWMVVTVILNLLDHAIYGFTTLVLSKFMVDLPHPPPAG